MNCVRKNISITAAQDAFLKKFNMSLSKIAQKAIEQEIKDFRFAMKVRKDLREMDRGNYEEMSADEFLKKLEEW